MRVFAYARARVYVVDQVGYSQPREVKKIFFIYLNKNSFLVPRELFEVNPRVVKIQWTPWRRESGLGARGCYRVGCDEGEWRETEV